MRAVFTGGQGPHALSLNGHTWQTMCIDAIMIYPNFFSIDSVTDI